VAPLAGFQRRPIIGILLLSLALRLLLPALSFSVVNDSAVFHAPDTSSYLGAAQGLLESGRFAQGGVPETTRTPGYPLLLLPGLLLGRVEEATILIQVILSCTTVMLVLWCSWLLFQSQKIALVSTVLYAIEPLSILYCSLLLTETLFTVLIVGHMCLFLSYLRGRSLKVLCGSAIALALSVYVRPISYYLCIPMALIVVLSGLRGRIRRPSRAVLDASTFFIVCMILIGAWQVRNTTVAEYHGFSSIKEVNLYFYQAASVIARNDGRSYLAVRDEMGFGNAAVYYANHPEQQDWARVDKYRFMGREGKRIILSNPAVYLRIHLEGMARTLLDPGSSEFLKLLGLYPRHGTGLLGDIIDEGPVPALTRAFGERPAFAWTTVVLGLFSVSLIMLSLVTVLSKNAFQRATVSVVVVGAYLWALSGGPVSVSRFRHPMMPVICLLAGYEAVGIAETMKRGRVLACASVGKLLGRRSPTTCDKSSRGQRQ